MCVYVHTIKNTSKTACVTTPAQKENFEAALDLNFCTVCLYAQPHFQPHVLNQIRDWHVQMWNCQLVILTWRAPCIPLCTLLASASQGIIAYSSLYQGLPRVREVQSSCVFTSCGCPRLITKGWHSDAHQHQMQAKQPLLC